LSNEKPPSPDTPWGATLLLGLTTGALLTAVCAVLYLREAGQRETTWHEREVTRVRVFARLFGTDFQAVANDVSILASGDGLQAYLDTGRPEDLVRAERRARLTSLVRREYDQVRYLDESGREVIRINKGGVAVPAPQLQDKHGHDYFERTKALPRGQVFLSAIDLNVEKGAVEEPFKPTLRFATPVFDGRGRARGVYVINFVIDSLFTRLQEIIPERNRVRILNAQGFWLKARTPGEEWGFMLPERASQSLALSEPALWARMYSEPTGQVPYHGGLLTWRHLVPAEMVPNSNPPAIAAEPFIIIASQVSSLEWDAIFRSLRNSFEIVAAALLTLVALGTWLLHLRHRERQEQDRFFSLSLDLLCISSAEGHFKRVSNAVTDILGWSVEEFKARPFIAFVHPDDHAATLREVERQVVAGEKVLHFENRYLCKDGSWRVLSWRSMPFPGGLMYATARDVTDLKATEDEIRRLNASLEQRASELERANKELEAFSYSVSHDLRAPLRHVDGFAGLLAKTDGQVLSEKGRGHLAQIVKSAKQMGVLIDDLLVFSRMGRSEMTLAPIDLGKLLEETLQGLAAEIEGRSITWEIGRLPVVHGDRPMMRQVLVNLLSNAIKYTGTRARAVITIGSEIKEGEDIVFVRDNGVGFEMEYAHKLFGVFQRLHRSEEFEGTGIGLANVRRIVSRHGGRTWAEGKLDEGAAFFFSIPRETQGTP
jgi:PAS domain S-box-containing protein